MVDLNILAGGAHHINFKKFQPSHNGDPCLVKVKRLCLELIPRVEEVVDDGGVEGGGVHRGRGAAHHHRVVRHVVHLGVDVLLLVAAST